MTINDRCYEIEILANETIDMELNFAPTEVASYDFDLPVLINRSSAAAAENMDAAVNRYMLSQLNSSTVTPYESEMGMSTAAGREKTPLTRKTSRTSITLLQKNLRRKVTAVGLRHALQLSSTLINFRIPIKYFENLKEGGFYEAKVGLSFISSNSNFRFISL